MSQRKISRELEPAVTELVKQRKSTRFIADWLRMEHEIKASHMTVHRFVERHRMQVFGAPDIDAELAEAQGEVGAHLRTLSALSEQFGDLGERAMEGDSETGLKPDMKLAGKLLAKQAKLITDWLRLLDRHAKGREEAVTAARQARARVNSELKLCGLTKGDKEAGGHGAWQQLVDEAERRERALGWKPQAAGAL